jgi:CBS domain containing-hemolysin-like protein
MDQITINHHKLQVLEIEKNRVKKVKITIHNPQKSTG